MASIPFRFGPQNLAVTTATDILSPGTSTGGVLFVDGVTGTFATAGNAWLNHKIVLYHVRVVNKGAGNATFSLFIGATGAGAAGSEFMGSAKVIAANDYVDWYGRMPIYKGQFLTGFYLTNVCSIIGEGDISFMA